MGNGRTRMDERMGAVLAEYSRVKRHRDLMVENVRRRKRVAREQEATIQRLAAERAELREEVELWRQAAEGVTAWPVDGNGRNIRMGDRVRCHDSEGVVDGMTYELRTNNWAPQGYEWWVKVGSRDERGWVKPGCFKVRPDRVEVIEDEPTVLDTLLELLNEYRDSECALSEDRLSKYAATLRLTGGES